MHELVTIVAQYFIAIPVLAYTYVFWRATNKDRLKLLITSAVCLAVTVALVKTATSLYHDPRPFLSDGVTPYFKGSTDNGFPSDHTTFSTLLAWLAFGRNRALGIGLLAIALLIGASRVVAGVHHGKDIVGGFIIATGGYWMGVLLVRLALQLRHRSASTEK